MRRGKVPLSVRGGQIHASLPGGRSIPTDFGIGHGGDPSVNVHPIVVRSPEEAREAAAQITAANPRAIISIIANDVRTGGAVFQSFKRKH